MSSKEYPLRPGAIGESAADKESIENLISHPHYPIVAASLSTRSIIIKTKPELSSAVVEYEDEAKTSDFSKIGD